MLKNARKRAREGNFVLCFSCWNRVKRRNGTQHHCNGANGRKVTIPSAKVNFLTDFLDFLSLLSPPPFLRFWQRREYGMTWKGVKAARNVWRQEWKKAKKAFKRAAFSLAFSLVFLLALTWSCILNDLILVRVIIWYWFPHPSLICHAAIWRTS